MAIAKMKKVYLIGHQAEKDCTLGLLQRLAVMEVNDLRGKGEQEAAWAGLVENDGVPDLLQEQEARLTEVRFSLDFLNRHFPEKKGLLSSLEDNRIRLDPDGFNARAADWQQESRDIHRELRRIDEQLMSIRNEETRLVNLRLLLQPWERLNVPLEEIHFTAQVGLELGQLGADELLAFRTALSDAELGVILEEIHADRENCYVFLAYALSDKEILDEIRRQFSFSRQDFSSLNGTIADNLARITAELRQAGTRRVSLLKEASNYVAGREKLHYYYDYLVVERDKSQQVSNLTRTEDAFVMEGWVREKDLPLLERSLASQCGTVLSFARAPEEGEAFPVALENPPVTAPFEIITTLYGTPHPRGIDPTTALAPFFVAFFGICMSDAGYGLVIAALGAFILWRFKLGVAGRRAFKMVLAGGISTIIFGALIGGWFGGLIPLQPLWFDALEDPMRLLLYALGVGIFQIFVGLGIMFYRNARDGKWLDAIFDQLFWALFIVGLLLFALPQAGGVARVLSLVAAAGLILTQGRGQKGIFKKFASGLFSLYDVTGYLGDILSYSRLLALGLATGVIAKSVNMLALMLGGTIPGTIVMVIMLVGGHAFNLVINVLGAYVHSSRLQYLEFFGRFFESGGRPFKPFRLNTNHVDVTPD